MAVYDLITAVFGHRSGRTSSPADAQITHARVEEHRNLGVAFYKTAMLDEAAREFRRVAELRPGEANAHFYIGLAPPRLLEGDEADIEVGVRFAGAQLGHKIGRAHV